MPRLPARQAGGIEIQVSLSAFSEVDLFVRATETDFSD